MKITQANKDNFKSEVLESNIKVLIDFNASWCGPCKMLAPVLEELESSHSDFKIVSVNVDDEEELASEYGVSSIPCLVVIKDGKEVKRSVGFMPKEEIENMMGEI